MNAFFSDLHFHAIESQSIDERIGEIRKIDPKNKGIWAVTNHNKFSPDFVFRAREEGIQAVWATEISAHSDVLNCSLQVLCYTRCLCQRINFLVQEIVKSKLMKIRGQIRKFQENNFPISEESFFSWITRQKILPENVTNWHIAQYIWQQDDAVAHIDKITNQRIISAQDFLREFLSSHGEFSYLGHQNIPTYEPELDTIVELSENENAVLSIAHPNSLFRKGSNTVPYTTKTAEQIRIFRDTIIPVISEAGIYNYEVDTLASPEWTKAIIDTIGETKGMITFGSNNHELGHTDKKHGPFGQINAHLTTLQVTKTIESFHAFF